MTSFAHLALNGARSPHSQFDIILIMRSFTTELATPSITDERTLCRDTLPRLIYEDADGSCVGNGKTSQHRLYSTH